MVLSEKVTLPIMLSYLEKIQRAAFTESKLYRLRLLLSVGFSDATDESMQGKEGIFITISSVKCSFFSFIKV